MQSQNSNLYYCYCCCGCFFYEVTWLSGCTVSTSQLGFSGLTLKLRNLFSSKMHGEATIDGNLESLYPSRYFCWSEKLVDHFFLQCPLVVPYCLTFHLFFYFLDFTSFPCSYFGMGVWIPLKKGAKSIENGTVGHHKVCLVRGQQQGL